MGLGVLAAVSRVAYDYQSCERDCRDFSFSLGRQFCLAIFAIVVANGVTSYYKLDAPISNSIILLSGFFAVEIVEQIKIVLKKVPCLLRLRKK